MARLTTLQNRRDGLIADRQRLTQQIQEIQALIDAFQAALATRPAGIPLDWEPILTKDGLIKGWADPSFAPGA